MDTQIVNLCKLTQPTFDISVLSNPMLFPTLVLSLAITLNNHSTCSGRLPSPFPMPSRWKFYNFPQIYKTPFSTSTEQDVNDIGKKQMKVLRHKHLHFIIYLYPHSPTPFVCFLLLSQKKCSTFEKQFSLCRWLRSLPILEHCTSCDSLPFLLCLCHSLILPGKRPWDMRRLIKEDPEDQHP